MHKQVAVKYVITAVTYNTLCYTFLLQGPDQQQHRCPPASPAASIQGWWRSSPLVSGGPPWTRRLRVLLGAGQCAAGQCCPQGSSYGGQLGPSRHCQLALLPRSDCQGTQQTSLHLQIPFFKKYDRLNHDEITSLLPERPFFKLSLQSQYQNPVEHGCMC